MRALFHTHESKRVPRDTLKNLFEIVRTNEDYRRVVETIPGQVQTVVMNIPPRGGIPEEVHPDTTQSIVVVEGSIKVRIDGWTLWGRAGTLVNVPKGSRHQVWNDSSDEPLKLYTQYWPPEHDLGLVQPTFT
jgi:mannose-6-phosphate isomerase-like protein (cupin superfamily)